MERGLRYLQQKWRKFTSARNPSGVALLPICDPRIKCYDKKVDNSDVTDAHSQSARVYICMYFQYVGQSKRSHAKYIASMPFVKAVYAQTHLDSQRFTYRLQLGPLCSGSHGDYIGRFTHLT